MKDVAGEDPIHKRQVLMAKSVIRQQVSPLFP
jgi:hypothetical protein